MKQELERMYDHIDDIEIAMMTTRRGDGHLQSRAMATQKRAEGADPRMVLIGVDVDAAVFLEVNKPQPVVLFEVVKGWLTGSTPDIGETHHVRR